MSDTIHDPGEGFTICDIGDPCRSHFWCQNEGRWFDIREVKNSTQWCEEKHGHKCATHWRKPRKMEKTSMSEWVYFSERKPVEGKDYPIAIIVIDTHGRVVKDSIFHLSYLPSSLDWTAWRSIGPLPKPVDEGERLAQEYVKDALYGHERSMSDFLAGYQAGLKKGKG